MNGLKLVVAAISGEIYLTKILRSGQMGSQRREFGKETRRAVMEWFMVTKTKQVAMTADDGSKVYLFHTADQGKADRILTILQEGEVLQ
jgi:hypothetical protein